MGPALGSSSLIIRRISVDLPEPDGPTRNTKSPRAIENVACSTPMSPESYSIATPRNSMTGGAWSAGSGGGTRPGESGLGGGVGCDLSLPFPLRGATGVDDVRRGRVGAGMGGRIRGDRPPACKGPGNRL